jgi:hypothetical protein
MRSGKHSVLNSDCSILGCIGQLKLFRERSMSETMWELRGILFSENTDYNLIYQIPFK